MPRAKKVVLDFAALAQTATDTGERIKRTRQGGPVAEYVPSPLAALITASFESGTAQSVPLPSSQHDSFDPDDMTEEQEAQLEDEANAIIYTLRKDAAHLGLGLKTTTYSDSVEFMGAPLKAKFTEDERKTAVATVNAGTSVADVAAALGTGPSTVAGWLKRYA